MAILSSFTHQLFYGISRDSQHMSDWPLPAITPGILAERSRRRHRARRRGGGARHPVRRGHRRLHARARLRATAAGRARQRRYAARALPRQLRGDRPGTLLFCSQT